MAGGATLTRFKEARYNFYRWRFESPFLVKFGLAWVFAALTGLGALIKLYLPWTPVPITGQVFFVLAAGVVLGRHYGGLSMIIYALVGLAGVPWFAGDNAAALPLVEGLPGLYQGVGGLAILFSATFGYILGFVLAAFLIGGVVDARVRFRRYTYLTPLLLLGVGIIYLAGLVWLYVWWTTGLFGLLEPIGSLSLWGLLLAGAIPFIPLDLVKTGIVVGIGGSLLPKRAYGAERDA